MRGVGQMGRAVYTVSGHLSDVRVGLVVVVEERLTKFCQQWVEDQGDVGSSRTNVHLNVIDESGINGITIPTMLGQANYASLSCPVHSCIVDSQYEPYSMLAI